MPQIGNAARQRPGISARAIRTLERRANAEKQGGAAVYQATGTPMMNLRLATYQAAIPSPEDAPLPSIAISSSVPFDIDEARCATTAGIEGTSSLPPNQPVGIDTARRRPASQRRHLGHVRSHNSRARRHQNTSQAGAPQQRSHAHQIKNSRPA